MKKGDVFEVDFIVNQDIYDGFIGIFKDKNPLHTDDRFAKSKGFESMVMHGNILGGFLSYFIGECLPIKNVIIHSQDIKYSKPVYLNDILVLKASINEVYESVNAVEFKYSFVKKKSIVENKPVMVAKGKIQIGIIA